MALAKESSHISFLQLLLFIISLCQQCSSQQNFRTAMNQVLGTKWIMYIKPSRRQTYDILFPAIVSSKGEAVKSQSDRNYMTNLKQKIKKNLLNPRDMLACELFMKSDGTFLMTPTINSLGTAVAKDANRTSYLPLQGKWTIHQNPYCVTDRFIDELELHSFQRTRKKTQQVITKHSKITRIAGVEKIQLELHCRLWGRYLSIRRQHTQGAVKLIRGTIFMKRSGTKHVINNMGIWSNALHNRACLGTFQAFLREDYK